MATRTVEIVDSSTPADVFSSRRAVPGMMVSYERRNSQNASNTSPSFGATSSKDSCLLSSRNIAIAGSAAGVGVLLTIAVGMLMYCCLRWRRQRQARRHVGFQFHKPVPKDARSLHGESRSGTFTTRLAYRREATPDLPASFAPAYTLTTSKDKELEPQEIMGLGLSTDEFNRRNRSRSPVHSLDGPVELASQRFSAINPHIDDKCTLPELRHGRTKERSSRLRNSPGVHNLRVEASRSPSASPGRRLLPYG
ncbi:hypothetical protein LTR96_009633 [Exophiala xenobiotica]|nr:hypothetical protein LTR96_009633 [Exophiala xenobiotica]KAK5287819.1 hypothetical protein LTR14_008602 [Exophiala xenobiotica]KAK5333679.1 hypothetical protein LTR98_010017 [Exophiala xenobiotica]KAK5348763.1 hypothetical protein LTR61_007790 [Exophiala xenobiotica]KAK5367928.1 hypothetical protein LTS03_008072 [Exophiala xenobiotica]